MDKVNSIVIIVIAVISVVLTVLIANLLLDTTGKVNQGNYRVSDIIIESTASLVEVKDDETQLTNLSDLVFDITQTNNISILVDAKAEIAEAAIENFTINRPELIGKLTICQKDYDLYEITDDFNTMPLNMQKQDDNYIINLCIDNENVLVGKSVDESVGEIQYDAKLIDTLGIDLNTLKFSISFDLCIKDINGTVSRAKIALNMPSDETFVEGMSILRQDSSKIIFTVLD